MDGREQQGGGAVRAVLAGAQRRRRDILILPGGLVEAIRSKRAAAINNVGIERVGRDVSIFLYAHRMPIAKGDLAIIAAAGDAGGAALLLAAIDPIRKTVVGDHVVEL